MKMERHLAESNASKYIMEYSQNILANDPKGTVNKLYRRNYTYVQKNEVRWLTMTFPSKHEGSNHAIKALIDTKDSDNQITDNQ